MKELTGTMLAAIQHTRMHGALVRQPGGSWVAPKDENDWSWSRVRFGASTIAGLVKRGELTYTEHKEGRNGQFPIRATVAQPANDSSASGSPASFQRAT